MNICYAATQRYCSTQSAFRRGGSPIDYRVPPNLQNYGNFSIIFEVYQMTMPESTQTALFGDMGQPSQPSFLPLLYGEKDGLPAGTQD